MSKLLYFSLLKTLDKMTSSNMFSSLHNNLYPMCMYPSFPVYRPNSAFLLEDLKEFLGVVAFLDLTYRRDK